MFVKLPEATKDHTTSLASHIFWESDQLQLDLPEEHFQLFAWRIRYTFFQ